MLGLVGLIVEGSYLIEKGQGRQTDDEKEERMRALVTEKQKKENWSSARWNGKG